MTRDELRERIATLVATLSIAEATDHILALIPPQPKLEWRDTGLRGDFEELCLGGLVVGFIFMRADGYGFLGQVGARVEMGVAFRTREKARAAVEDAVRKALVMNND